VIEDRLSYCPNPLVRPTNCPLEHGGKASSRVTTWILTGVFLVVALFGGYSIRMVTIAENLRTATRVAEVKMEQEVIGVQLASQVTILYPSYLTYNQQKMLLQKTLLAKVDFIYIERRIYEETGIYVDALTIMAICAHESGWGSNHWATQHNNPMSWGINEHNPDQTIYPSATYGVYIAVRGLVSLYYKVGAPYYSLTLWNMNKYYCPSSAASLAWANDVDEIYDALEAKLTPEQQMRRWAGKTGLIDVPTDWLNDATHRLGWALYKTNKAVATTGR
jgi:hypothetical protein